MLNTTLQEGMVKVQVLSDSPCFTSNGKEIKTSLDNAADGSIDEVSVPMKIKFVSMGVLCDLPTVMVPQVPPSPGPTL
jgi:hypothetical protein